MSVRVCLYAVYSSVCMCRSVSVCVCVCLARDVLETPGATSSRSTDADGGERVDGLIVGLLWNISVVLVHVKVVISPCVLVYVCVCPCTACMLVDLYM